jgi:hypothetical protein
VILFAAFPTGLIRSQAGNQPLASDDTTSVFFPMVFPGDKHIITGSVTIKDNFCCVAAIYILKVSPDDHKRSLLVVFKKLGQAILCQEVGKAGGSGDAQPA